jgi:hypothetical protein
MMKLISCARQSWFGKYHGIRHELALGPLASLFGIGIMKAKSMQQSTTSLPKSQKHCNI